LRHRFDDPHEVRQTQLQATEILWKPEREEAEFTQRLDKSRWQSTFALDFVPQPDDGWAKLGGRLNQANGIW
jgi:hypothetical protein